MLAFPEFLAKSVPTKYGRVYSNLPGAAEKLRQPGLASWMKPTLPLEYQSENQYGSIGVAWDRRPATLPNGGALPQSMIAARPVPSIPPMGPTALPPVIAPKPLADTSWLDFQDLQKTPYVPIGTGQPAGRSSPPIANTFSGSAGAGSFGNLLNEHLGGGDPNWFQNSVQGATTRAIKAGSNPGAWDKGVKQGATFENRYGRALENAAMRQARSGNLERPFWQR